MTETPNDIEYLLPITELACNYSYEEYHYLFYKIKKLKFREVGTKMAAEIQKIINKNDYYGLDYWKLVSNKFKVIIEASTDEKLGFEDFKKLFQEFNKKALNSIFVGGLDYLKFRHNGELEVNYDENN